MRKILKNLKNALTPRLVFLRLAMPLMALALITSCDRAPKFPSDVHVYVPFFDLKFCAEYRVVSVAPLQIEPTGDKLPLEYCDKIYGLMPGDQVKLNAWIDDTMAWAKNNCK